MFSKSSGILVLLLFAALSSFTLIKPDPCKDSQVLGTWTGTLENNGAERRLTIKITRDQSGYLTGITQELFITNDLDLNSLPGKCVAPSVAFVTTLKSKGTFKDGNFQLETFEVIKQEPLCAVDPGRKLTYVMDHFSGELTAPGRIEAVWNDGYKVRNQDIEFKRVSCP